MVIVKEKKNYSYLPMMCAGVLKNASKEFMKNVKPVTSEQNPKKIAPTVAAIHVVRTCQRGYFKVLTLKLLHKAMFKHVDDSKMYILFQVWVINKFG